MPNPHDTSLTLSELLDRCTTLLNAGESPHAATGILELKKLSGDCLGLHLETEDSGTAAFWEEFTSEITLPEPKGNQTPVDVVVELFRDREDRLETVENAADELQDELEDLLEILNDKEDPDSDSVREIAANRLKPLIDSLSKFRKGGS